MPVNVWSAGRDALLDDLARRDAKRLQESQLARQTRMDEESRVARERQFGLQEEQLGLQKQDRDMRATAALAAQGAAQEKNQRIQQAIRRITDPTTPQPEKDALGLILDQEGVSPAMLERFAAPKPAETQDVYAVGLDGRPTKVSTVPKGSHFTQVDRPVGGNDEDSGLPPSVRAYVDALPTQVASKREAIDLVNRNFAEMRRKGEPLPDMVKVIERINKRFPAEPGLPGMPTTFPGTSMGAPPAPAPTTAAPRTLAAGGGMAPQPAGPSPDDAAAIALLTEAGKAVTAETIAIVKQRMAAGQ
jgi:hypothetical protein